MDTPNPKDEENPFILLNGIDKADPEKRRLIRKYVMLGKNRGKTRSVKPTKTITLRNPQPSHRSQDEATKLLMKMSYPKIPNKVGDELSFSQFAAPVEPQLMRDVLKFSMIAKKIMYPLEFCIEFHRKTRTETMWFELMTYDAAYMHAVAFSAQVFSFHISGNEDPAAARKAIIHHSSALRILRERLSIQNEDGKISDATIFVVLSLARHAHLTNDSNSAIHHMKALRKIVSMRGGIHAFRYNIKLIMELMKYDLGIALNNGIPPIFFQEPSLEPLIPYDLKTPTAEETRSSKPPGYYWTPIEWNVDPELTQAWTVMRRFCSIINTAAKQHRRLPHEILVNTMGSVMYRLINMTNIHSTSVDESIRLSLLAFSSHIFLDFRDIKFPHIYFPQIYRTYIMSHLNATKLSSQFLLWLVTVGTISGFTPADDNWLVPWVRTQTEIIGVTEWSELHDMLEGFLWIDALHNKAAQAMFNSARSFQKDVEG